MEQKKTPQSDINKFKHLNFQAFQNLAQDDSLSPYQKIGFPDAYREGKEKAIFEDILLKITALQQAKSTVLDIGCGCSDLVFILMKHCSEREQLLLLNDGQAMLDLLPTQTNIQKIAGYFPNQTVDILNNFQQKIDVILTYSVFHYVFEEGNIFSFLDNCVNLLAPKGQLLIGDIPNVSKRKRFFASQTGINYHQNYTQSDTLPPVFSYEIEPNQIDDGVLFGIIQRYRNAGCEAYILPQSENLPMSNRREDILIIKN
jgi:2-polyprenyl-3-methyl-5-hydroxy-6-metoxy-1,4-benzoquinol methylase